jgi:hypothetical protein
MSRIMVVKPILRFNEGMEIKFRYMDYTYQMEVLFTVLRRDLFTLDVDVNKGLCIIEGIYIYRTETRECFYLPRPLGGAREIVFPINHGGNNV